MAASISPARRVAWEILGEVRQRQAFARDLLREAPQMDGLSGRDRALCMRLVMGVTQSCGTLDRAIESHLSGRKHLEPRVRDALRLEAFEVMYLSTPAGIAVSQGVELVRIANRRASGLANAVLRRVAGEDAAAVDAARRRVEQGSTAQADLALVSGLPGWIIAEAAAALGEAGARWLAMGALEPAPVYVAANRLRATPEELEGALESAGLDPRRVTDFGTFQLGRPAELARSGLVDAAVAVPSDLAAQLVARIAACRPGERLLEVGQGRGTKSLLLEGATGSMGGLGRIEGVDNVPRKREIARARMRRARLDRVVTCLTLDALRLADPSLPAEFAHPFDVVFVDAPCSGLGTLRRHPETSWSLDARSLDPGSRESLPALQLQILRAASARVRVGGALVYSTCSFARAENQGVVEAFLRGGEGVGFSLASPMLAPGVKSLSADDRSLVEDCVDEDGFFTSALPGVGCDVHFCARMVRTV